MNAVYLFCLVVGGVLAGLSAFGDFFDDVDVDADADLDVDTVSDPGDAVSGHGEIGYVASIFSFRSLIFALLGFGATGALLSWFGSSPAAPLTVGLSAGAGLTVGALVGAFLGFLKRSDTGPREGEASFEGLTGRVTLPLAAGGAGRIVVTRGGREHAVRALPYPRESAGDPSDWTAVLVVEMRDGIAYVEPLDDEGRDLLGPGRD